MNLIKYYSEDDKSEKFKEGQESFGNAAFYSLKIALKSYFNTYHCMLGNLIYEDNNSIKKVKLDYEYYESYMETIVHFQHFFELITKDILEKENPLLALRHIKKPVILHKLLNKEEISESEYNESYSIDFNDVLETIYELVKNDRLSQTSCKIISKNKDTLSALNNFRNRIWHRGKFVLKYHSLDEFICKYVLPIVIEISNLDEYKCFKHEWEYRQENELAVDILEKLIKEFETGLVDYTKIALFKEIGRASYDVESKLLGPSIDEKIKMLKKFEEKHDMIFNVHTCPVCGNESLLNYYSYEEWIDELGDEMGPGAFQIINGYDEVEKYVRCVLCDFEVNKFVKDPCEYGLGNWIFWDNEF